MHVIQQSTSMQNMQRNSGLLNGNSRHQRDLFTGSLGIPDVSTRVGSVVHAFELMARNSSESPADTIGRASDLSLLAAENPYEMHADHTIAISAEQKLLPKTSMDVVDAMGITGKRQSIYQKADNVSGTMPTVRKSSQQTIKRHVKQYSDIPTPPPPPVVSQNLPILQPIRQAIDDEFSSFEAISPAPTLSKYPSHTLPHGIRTNDQSFNANDINERTRQFIPASQLLRAADHQRQRSKMQRSSAVSGQLARKRAVELTRTRTVDDSVGRSTNDASNTIGDYRRTMFGSQPNVIHDSHILHNHAHAQTTLARLNGYTANTNYANIDFRETHDHRSLCQPNGKKSPHPTRQQPHLARSHTKNDDTNNNRQQQQQQHSLHQRQLQTQNSDLFAMHSQSGLGNRFMNRTNTINNSNNNGSHGQHTNNNRLTSTNANYAYHDDGDDDTDDATFLRGTTVSQSFIKNMKNTRANQLPATHLANAAGANGVTNAFQRSEPIKPMAPSKSTPKRLATISRNYYRPQKYILNDDDEYENELRTRYTEHTAHSNRNQINNNNRRSLQLK